MSEQPRTIVRYQLSLSTANACQHYNIWNNTYDVSEFPKCPIIVSLFDSTITDTEVLIFSIQSMIVTPSKKEHTIK